MNKKSNTGKRRKLTKEEFANIDEHKPLVWSFPKEPAIRQRASVWSLWGFSSFLRARIRALLTKKSSQED